MKTRRVSGCRTALWMVAAGFGVGCGGGGGTGEPDPTMTGPGPDPTMMVADPAAFTEEEAASVQNSLGVLPGGMTLDLSNKYADHAGAATLGQKFYFETRYSANGKVSCATCHKPDAGFQDDRANTSMGLDQMFTGRHAPTVINAAFGSGKMDESCWHFWDGRRDSQWAQALGPPESPVEMGGTRTGVALLIYDHYRAEYEAVFGPIPELRPGGMAVAPLTAMPGAPEWDALPETAKHDINAVYVNFGKAIAAYERKIVSRNSRFDRFYAEFTAGKTDSAHLTAEEKLGLKVFVGKGRCIACHRGPAFSDWKFHNIAEPQLGPHLPEVDAGRAEGIAGAVSAEFNCMSEWSDHPDKASCTVATTSSKPGDMGAFKTPGLRDISKQAPYMHTGRLNTLAEVVDHYDQGGAQSGFVGMVDRDVQKLNLTPAEKAALVKFMLALDGEPLPPHLLTAPALPGI